MDDSLLVGGSVSLTNLIDLFDQNAPLYPPYAVLADHIRKVSKQHYKNHDTLQSHITKLMTFKLLIIVHFFSFFPFL